MKLVLKNEARVEPVIAFELQQIGHGIELIASTENGGYQTVLFIETIDNKAVAQCASIFGDTAMALGYENEDKFICTEAND